MCTEGASIWKVIYRWQMVTILWVSHCKMCWAKWKLGQRQASDADLSKHLYLAGIQISQQTAPELPYCWSQIYPGMRAVLSYVSAPRTSKPQAGQPWPRIYTVPSFRLLWLVLFHMAITINYPSMQWLSSEASSMHRQGRHKQVMCFAHE